jgi:hypothetical protein
MAQSGTTTKAGLFIPEILADAIEAGFAGLNCLYGTGAVAFNTTLPAGPDDVGDTVKVPYFDLIGDMDDVSVDGGELSPAKLTSSADMGTIQHSGKGIEFTRWSRMNPTDPYAEGARQIAMSAQRRADKAMIDVAKDTTNWSAYTKDVFSATAPKLLDYDQIVNGISTLGDEGHGEAPALIAVHSKVMGDLRLAKDADGSPRLVKTAVGSLPVLDTLGIPIMVSDKLVSTLSGGVAKYQSLLMWPQSVVFWMNGAPLIMSEQNARKPSDSTYVHIYWVAHRYRNRRQKSKPGVVHLFHN